VNNSKLGQKKETIIRKLSIIFQEIKRLIIIFVQIVCRILFLQIEAQLWTFAKRFYRGYVALLN
jgi:hypothetical protein